MGNVRSIQKPCRWAVEANNEVLQTLQDKNQQEQTEPIMGMESLQQEVCHCFMDKRVRILGMHGSQGVGKTTLLTLVYHKFHNTPTGFDVVIWVTVSRAPRLARVQADIWNQLGIYDDQWENKSISEKATDIFNVLSKKRFLLLLDDLWERIDLIKVGVPLQGSEYRSKIAITTSDSLICRKMNVDKQITVPYLEESDAWKLFEKKVGEEILCIDPDIRRIAGLVVYLCNGIPLILNVACRDMANKKTVQEWRDAEEILMRTDLHKSILMLRFHNLPNERVKSCFIYCALFPSNFKILKEDLVSYWICENFWEDCDNGVDVAEGYHIIDTLVDACLLEDKGDYVTMHALIQNEALHIARKREKLFVKAGDQLVAAPEIAKWKRVSRMSLMENNIPNLTQVPVCPYLLTLFLSHNPHLVMIIDGFFQYMNALTVLDLSNTNINELPLGISRLVSLQYLDISHTWIEQLPVELQMLSKLKYFKLEHNGLLRFVPRQVIASMPRLQVLRIFSCGVSLVPSEDNILSYHNEHVDELQGLEYLHTLSITITSSAALQSLFSIFKSRICTKALSLKCFWGTISLDISLLADMNDLKTLEIYKFDHVEKLKVCMKIKEANIQGPDTLHKSAILWERSFNNLQEVTVRKCFHLKELTWVILAPNLKVLKVIDCKEMEEIISINKAGEISNVTSDHLNTFFNLQIIVLEKLPKLKSIYWSALSFPCLEKIKIVDCPILKKLPLNSKSAMGQRVVIQAKEHWWNCIDWEDDATRIAFLLNFIQIS